MPTMTDDPPRVKPAPAETRYADEPEVRAWLKAVRDAQDLAVLLSWARQSLPAAPIPCVCNDGSCRRCVVEHVLAERDALEGRP